MIFKNNLLPKNLDEYHKLYKQSVENPESFWTDVAESFNWNKKWSKVVNFDFSKPSFKGFKDARLNMTENCEDDDFLVLNPDTLWSEKYVPEIDKMQNFYFSNKMNNILLVVKKELSFDQNLKGDFELKKNLLDKKGPKNFIFTGCQILNKNLFNSYKVENFPIAEIWESLLKINELYGFESLNKFYHLTNLEIFKKLEVL